MKSLKNLWKIVITIVLTATAWLYGGLTGELTNKSISGEIDLITITSITNLALIAILAFTFLRLVFPSYTPLKQSFPKYYPLSTIQVYFASVFNDFYRPYFFYILVYILSVSYYLENSGLDFFYIGFLTLVSSHLLRRCLHYLVDFSSQLFGRLLAVLIIPFVFLCWIFPAGSLSFSGLEITIITVVLLLIGFAQEIAITGSRNNEVSGKFINKMASVKLLYNNHKVRLPLIIGLLSKVLILISDLLLFKAKGIHLFEDGQVIFWLFASPLIIFTYVFNNVWGFYSNIWLNMELRVGYYKPMITYTLRIMLLPIIFDFIITIPILLLSWNEYQFTLLFYFTTAFYLILLSFLWSLIAPRKVRGVFQMKGSCSPMSNIVAVSGVLLLASIRANDWFYILIPVYFIIGIMAYWISLKLYNDKKYAIFSRLFKE